MSVPEAAQVVQWNRLLGRTTAADPSESETVGPNLELVATGRFEIESIVLEVLDLAAAAQALVSRGLPATAMGTTVRL